MNLKWNDCVYLNGNKEIIDVFCRKSHQLFILGRGFDPRTCEGVKVFNSLNNNMELLIVNYLEKKSALTKQYKAISDQNYKNLKQLCTGKVIKEIDVRMWREEIGKKISLTHESIRNKVTIDLIKGYDEIIVDISAMPRSVSFNLIKRLNNIKSINQKLYILVCENSEFDDQIEPIIAEGTAEYLQGFNSFSMGMEANSDSIKVWIPILGFNELAALEKIADFLKPDEICPVLPFPAQDPRRGENTLRYYGEYLFKTLDIEKRNIIFVPEKQPILVYKKLCSTVKYYENALNYDSNNEIRYIFSSQSSKLMDVGVLLTVLDLQGQSYIAGIAIVENEGYKQNGEYNEKNNKLSCVCLDDREFEW